MTNFNKNNEKKTTQRLPMTGKVKKAFILTAPLLQQ